MIILGLFSIAIISKKTKKTKKSKGNPFEFKDSEGAPSKRVSHF